MHLKMSSGKWRPFCLGLNVLKTTKYLPLSTWTGSSILDHLGWGLLSRFPPFRYFPNFSALSKHTLDIEYHVYIWQVSPQLSCGDTCQIWKWFKESNRYFWKIENFAYGEINERGFSNPHPWGAVTIAMKFAESNHHRVSFKYSLTDSPQRNLTNKNMALYLVV